MYKTIKIEKGPNGWGGPLFITPTEKKNKIVSITGKTVHPLAIKIAELLDCEIVNGFVTGVPEEEILVAVVDCGGTARCGVYPKKRIFTVNVMPVGQAGPLAQFITEDIYVSDVKEKHLSIVEDGEVRPVVNTNNEEMTNKEKGQMLKQEAREKVAGMKVEKENILTRLGKATGGVIAIFYQSGREVIETVIKNILPPCRRFASHAEMTSLRIDDGASRHDWTSGHHVIHVAKRQSHFVMDHPRRCSRGSSRSRSPSPSRLSPSTDNAIATPGHTASSGAWNISVCASASMRPQLGCGGCVPRPR